MACLFNRRGNFDGGAFTLLELMVTFALIGIIVALLIPKLVEVREEAYRQTARQQAKVLETALANWFMAQPNLKAASITWDSYSTNGYITSATFLTSALAPYLDSSCNFIPDSFTPGTFYTSEMKLILVPSGNPAGTGFIVDASDLYCTPALLYNAHVRLYWNPNNRTTVSPKVYFFLPIINSNS